MLTWRLSPLCSAVAQIVQKPPVQKVYFHIRGALFSCKFRIDARNKMTELNFKWIAYLFPVLAFITAYVCHSKIQKVNDK